MKTVCKQLVLFLVVSQCIIPALWSMELEREETVSLISSGSCQRYNPKHALARIRLLPPELIRLISTFLPAMHAAIPILLNFTGINAHEADTLVKAYIRTYRIDPRPFFNAKDYAALAEPIEKAWKKFNKDLETHTQHLVTASSCEEVYQYLHQLLPGSYLVVDPEMELTFEEPELKELSQDLACALYYLQHAQRAIDHTDKRSGCARTMLDLRGTYSIAALYIFLGINCLFYYLLFQDLFNPEFDVWLCTLQLYNACYKRGISACYDELGSTRRACLDQLIGGCNRLAAANCTTLQQQFNREHSTAAAEFRPWIPIVVVLGGALLIHTLYVLSAKVIQPRRPIAAQGRMSVACAIKDITTHYSRVQARLDELHTA